MLTAPPPAVTAPTATATAPTAGRRPVGWALPLVTLVLGVYFVTGSTSGGPARLWTYWAAVLLLDVVAMVATIVVARRTPAGPKRTFWRAYAVVTAAFLTGDCGAALFALGGPAWAQQVQGTLLVGGYLTILITMLRYPVRWRSARARLTFWLDTGTVAVAAAAVNWFLTIRDERHDITTTGIALGVAAIFVLTTFAGARLAASGQAPTTRATALLLIGSAALTSVINGMGLLAPDRTNAAGYTAQMLLWLLPSVLATAGTLAQFRNGQDHLHQSTQPRRRSFSLLPYAAIAVTLGLLLVSVAVSGNILPRTIGVLVAVLASVSLVVARQLVSFTDNDRLLARIQRQEQRMSALLQHSSDIIVITDAQLRCDYVSPAVTRLLGYEPERLQGRNTATMVHPEDRTQAAAALRHLLAEGNGTATHQARYRHADGSWRWLEVITTNLVHSAHVGGLISNCREVTAARELQELLEHKATHDPLTRLANRALFQQRLDEVLTGPAGRLGLPARAAVLAIDLDDFKSINDTYGHHGGDDALIGLADKLSSCLRGSDLAARLGGDEFAVLLPHTTAGEATLVAQRFLDALKIPVVVDGEHHLTLSCSIGVAGSTSTDSTEVLKAADHAMYRAKQNGKNQYTVYDTATASVPPPGAAAA